MSDENSPRVSTSHKLMCRDCGRRVPFGATCSIRRTGGGNYRRAGRSYLGETCVRCVEETLRYAGLRDGRINQSATASRYSVLTLLRALVSFLNRGLTDLDEGRWRAAHPDNRHEPFEEYWAALTATLDDMQRRDAERLPETRATLRSILDPS